MSDLAGIRVIESDMLPTDPSPGEVARRIVRHGLADVLAWLGEPVGPSPTVQTHALLHGSDLIASTELVGEIRRQTGATT